MAETEHGGGLILVVDDDAKIAHLVEQYLLRAGFRVEIAGDGVEALRKLRALEPDLVVLDLMLPMLDGYAVTRAAREGGNVPIVIMSARGSTSERIAGLELGADDYVAKPFVPTELVARVRSVLRRARPAAAAGPLVLGDLVIDPERRLVLHAGREVDLSAVEFELLRALVAAQGRVMTREMLIDAIHPHYLDAIQDRSIDVYIRRLRTKLDDDPESPRYVVTVRGVGYRTAAVG